MKRHDVSVAVVAHRRKELDGGLNGLRAALAERGVTDPLWYEVDKSRKAAGKARKAVDKGAEVLFVWGGDGTVQHCLEALTGTSTAVAVLPAGTANTLAANLGVPAELHQAVDIGLDGMRRVIDLVVVNDELGTVMAGAGFDAELLAAADRDLKERLGRFAYLWTGLRKLGARRRGTEVRIDGDVWFDGRSSCVLVGNMGRMMGGLDVFTRARPDDGMLHVGIITAEGPWQWLRLFARLLTGRLHRSPFTRSTTGRRVDVRFAQKTRYEIDGGERSRTKRLRASVKPGALVVCVPRGCA